MSKILLIIPILLFVLPSFAGNHKVIKVNVKKGQVVTHKISVTPGFAVLLEVPDDIVSHVLTDPNVFSCVKNPPSYKKILCKPLLTKRFSTNLVVSTENNEFNFVLVIDKLLMDNPFKYVFSNGSSYNKKTNFSAEKNMNSNSSMIHTLLEDYDHKVCRSKDSSHLLELECVERIKIGAETFIRFKLSSKAKEQVQVLNCAFVVRSYGGFTGLSLKESRPIPSQYRIKSDNLRFGEETYGIVKMPRASLNQGQKLSLAVFTDMTTNHSLELRRF